MGKRLVLSAAVGLACGTAAGFAVFVYLVVSNVGMLLGILEALVHPVLIAGTSAATAITTFALSFFWREVISWCNRACLRLTGHSFTLKRGLP